MDLASVKNEIKIIFYIINSFIGLVPGSILVGFGISVWAGYRGLEGVGLAALGLVGTGIATLGFAGAILEHKIMLIAYSCIISLLTLINVIMCLALNVGSYYFNIVWVGMSITHLSLTLIAVALSVTQARLIRRRTDQGRIISPPPSAPGPAPTSSLLDNDDSKIL